MSFAVCRDAFGPDRGAIELGYFLGESCFGPEALFLIDHLVRHTLNQKLPLQLSMMKNWSGA
jgi:hypothetical protein